MIERRAPGRVNLIGEHTDYSGGFVMPCAIGYYTRTIATPRADKSVVARSAFGEGVFGLEQLPANRLGDWRDYLRGILIELRGSGVNVPAADLTIGSDLPPGAGLSSSAALEISVALAILQLAQRAIDPDDLAQLAQRVENAYVGTQSGIMDQMAVLQACSGSAMLLDTRSLSFEHVRVPANAAIVICNTMVKHDNAAGAYNERRIECRQSAEALGVEQLRDVSAGDLERRASQLSPILYRRARHVVTENARTLEAATALRERNLRHLGELMYASHESLRHDYEVSCRELDIAVDIAREHPATYGARMTGGGFGGCTVNVVRRDRSEEFRSYLTEAYHHATGFVPVLYDGTPVAGAQNVND